MFSRTYWRARIAGMATDNAAIVARLGASTMRHMGQPLSTGPATCFKALAHAGTPVDMQELQQWL